MLSEKESETLRKKVQLEILTQLRQQAIDEMMDEMIKDILREQEWDISGSGC
jgi:hypothetical protein